MTNESTWDRFQKYFFDFPQLGLSIDLSRSDISDAFIAEMTPRLNQAFEAMKKLEAGAIANPDENRMVGHYWLRNPDLAPTPEIRNQITSTLAAIKTFAAKSHSGEIAAQGNAGKFTNLLVIGIGGSALGPEFVASALSNPELDRLKVHFFDNTDPDGMDRVLRQIGSNLKTTLTVVISKSGGTPETRNGMLVAKAAYEKAGLQFHQHAVAITGEGSNLDKFASNPAWLARFPMWDWVGGRTSETSAVGLLPAVLQGFDIDNVLSGAHAGDTQTRIPSLTQNPAALLALAWYAAVNGKGEKDMVILPYKDRLELFSRYLQQLIMESLGKEKDLSGKTVHQGIAVYGNKGSADQHAYIQQLREGVPNFFATFIEVLKDGSQVGPAVPSGPPNVSNTSSTPPASSAPAASATTTLEVEPHTTCGDFLEGFFLGTRKALHENGRTSITITIQEVSPYYIGLLIALYERAVGLYASLVNINAYHQPGVEAGKKAAAGILSLQSKILSHLTANKTQSYTAAALATAIGEKDPETTFKLLEHLAANRRIRRNAGQNWQAHQYSA
jgi:glucose-6-phosphate isomerase